MQLTPTSKETRLSSRPDLLTPRHGRVKSLENHISELEAQAARLMRALESEKTARSDAERTMQRKAEEASKELATQVRHGSISIMRSLAEPCPVQSTELEHLKSRMKQYSDYDELKRELEIMKVRRGRSQPRNRPDARSLWPAQYVEFSSGDNDFEDMRLPDPNAEKANQRHGKSLETLLTTKNKRLQEEATRLRVS